MAEQHDTVFATLVMTDSYLPGAMVLGHSLRDRGAKGRLAACVLLDKLSLDTISELQTVYDDVVPVQQHLNMRPANLYLMNRPDLISSFTKIELWRQTQYKRIVYLDADMVVLKAPNELLNMDTKFAAVPDVGWPDCFNSGMMVLNPNMGDFYSLLALAQRGISFDGGDQGLLNMHFTEWDRLNFTYNCTPNANYQYVPAYQHFQSSIKMIHFIGAEKPWQLGREGKQGSGVYSELLARWWAVYDRHYREPNVQTYNQYIQPRKKVNDYVKGEETKYEPSHHPPQPVPITVQQTPSQQSDSTSNQDQHRLSQDYRRDERPVAHVETKTFEASQAQWHPASQPPPTDSKPEAANFPMQHYEMSHSRELFEPPSRYPEPPKDMYYEVPQQPIQQPKMKPIFPWEEKAPKATRVFPRSREPSPPAKQAVPTQSNRPISPEKERKSSVFEETTRAAHEQQTLPMSPPRHIFPWEARAPKATRVFNQEPLTSPPIVQNALDKQLGIESASNAVSTSIDQEISGLKASASPWEAFGQQTNRWDEMPDIAQYMEALNKPRKAKIQVLHDSRTDSSSEQQGLPVTERRLSQKLTDFPTAIERPSLPVTPAPIRRPSFWGSDEATAEAEKNVLPLAQGVPRQDEWVRQFSSLSMPLHKNSLRDIHGTLHLTCQHCGKQNPIIKLEELQRLQQGIMLGQDSLEGRPSPPKRDMPDSKTVEEALRKVLDSMDSHERRGANAPKPILKESSFERTDADDDEVNTSPELVSRLHAHNTNTSNMTATGTKSPIRFNPIVLEGEASSERSQYMSYGEPVEELDTSEAQTSMHHSLPHSRHNQEGHATFDQTTAGDKTIPADEVSLSHGQSVA